MSVYFFYRYRIVESYTVFESINLVIVICPQRLDGNLDLRWASVLLFITCLVFLVFVVTSIKLCWQNEVKCANELEPDESKTFIHIHRLNNNTFMNYSCPPFDSNAMCQNCWCENLTNISFDISRHIKCPICFSWFSNMQQKFWLSYVHAMCQITVARVDTHAGIDLQAMKAFMESLWVKKEEVWS